MVRKSNNAPEEEDLNQEASSEEDLSYEEEFAALWGADESEEPETPEPTGDEEDVTDEESEETSSEEGQEVPAVAAAPSTPSPKSTSDPYQWIDSLPEEVREQARQLKHAAASQQGRAAAFQRRAEELQQELDRARTAPRPAPTADRAKASDPAAPELPSKFKQLKEDFPEFAEAVEEIRALDRQQYQKQLEERLTPLNEITARTKKAEFDSAVNEAAAEIFNTIETGVYWKDIVVGEDFRAWLALQPKSIQTAAGVPDPTEAVYVLRRYEEDYQNALKQLQSEATPATPASQKSTQADKVKEKRAQRMQKSVAPGSKPAAADPKHGGGGDYDAEFDAMWG